MGETINLVENFKVEKVIFNCGEYDDLEQSKIYRTDQDGSIIISVKNGRLMIEKCMS